jgi:hypothetical protein
MAEASPQVTPSSSAPARRGLAWRWLLVLPFVGLLWVPFYNSIEPAIWGVPFFYWYQFVWVFVTSGLIIFVMRQERRP